MTEILDPMTGLPYGEQRILPDMQITLQFIEKDGVECVKGTIPALSLYTVAAGNTVAAAAGRAVYSLIERAMDPNKARADALVVT